MPLVSTCVLIQNLSSNHPEIPLRLRLRVSDPDYFVVVGVLQMNQLWPPAIIVLCLSIKCAAGQAAPTGITDKHTGKTN